MEVGVGVAVGAEVEVGVGVDLAVAVGAGVTVGVAMGVGAAIAVGIADGIAATTLVGTGEGTVVGSAAIGAGGVPAQATRHSATANTHDTRAKNCVFIAFNLLGNRTRLSCCCLLP